MNKPLKIVFVDFTGTMDEPIGSSWKDTKVETYGKPAKVKVKPAPVKVAPKIKPIERARELVRQAKEAKKAVKPSLFQRFTKNWTAKKPSNDPNNFYEHVGKDFYVAPVTRVNEDWQDPYGHKYGGAEAKVSSKVRYYDDRTNTWKDVEQDTNIFRGHDYYEDDYYRDSYIGKGYKYTAINYGPDKNSVKFLKQLLDKTGAKIVYSSTRRSGGWESCANYLGLPKRYSLGGKFGVTPEVPVSLFGGRSEGQTKLIYTDGTMAWKERQQEIKRWFLQWSGVKILNYVILDDDPITDNQMKLHWVSSIAKNGFQKAEYTEALKILSKG
jgi:hypothetical protein